MANFHLGDAITDGSDGGVVVAVIDDGNIHYEMFIGEEGEYWTQIIEEENVQPYDGPVPSAKEWRKFAKGLLDEGMMEALGDFYEPGEIVEWDKKVPYAYFNESVKQMPTNKLFERILAESTIVSGLRSKGLSDDKIRSILSHDPWDMSAADIEQMIKETDERNPTYFSR